mmetsp:Transcript_27813/g.40300  ORF Transcript_27813/g.40300 Transcript_27813/m.40300 type:complete len:371 (+) Transcript_27813:350-1462(+)
MPRTLRYSSNANSSPNFFLNCNLIRIFSWFAIITFTTYWYVTYRILHIASFTQEKLVDKHYADHPLDRNSLIQEKLIDNKIQPNVDDPSDSTGLCLKRFGTGKCNLSACNGSGEGKRVGYGSNTFSRDTSIAKKSNPMGIGRGNGSGCVISHKYKFVYLHVLKNGGTAMKNFLRRGLCGDTPFDTPCAAGEKVFSTKLSCNQMVLNNPDYFVWTMVRNPFSRMFSAYAMLHGNPKTEKSKKVTFQKFVLDKLSRNSLSTMSKTHYAPQHLFLFANNDCPNFDFIGKLENMEEDMEYVLKRIGSPELSNRFESNNKNVKKVNTWGDSARENDLGGDLRAAYEDEDVLKTVANEFARDFRLLGYDDRNVPQH